LGVRFGKSPERLLREFAMNATLRAPRPAGTEYGPGYRAGFLLSGVILMLAGMFAMLAPMLSTLAVTLTLAISAAVGGIAQVVQAFRAPAWKGFFLNFLIGLAFLAAGVAFFLRPLTGALAITMMLSWLLLFTGIAEVLLGFRIRPERGWRWLIVSGLVAIGAGIWLMLRIPITGFFVPGIALGVALLFEGAAFVSIALDRKRDEADAEPGRAEDTKESHVPPAGVTPEGDRPAL
jgi:uncharacterized membrane protein HdeD (DUF308 family)